MTQFPGIGFKNALFSANHCDYQCLRKDYEKEMLLYRETGTRLTSRPTEEILFIENFQWERGWLEERGGIE